MSFRFSLISTLKRLTPIRIVLAATAFAIIVLASERIQRLPAVVVNASQPAAMTNASYRQSRSSTIETEVIRVTRRGFEPAAISRSPGKFILMIENPSWQSLNLRLSREAGESLHEVRTSLEEPDWNEVQDLRPGSYVLTEPDHPEWKCVITITAR
jgi:hypothetical protein